MCYQYCDNMFNISINVISCDHVELNHELKSYLNILQSADDLIHIMHWKRAEREETNI